MGGVSVLQDTRDLQVDGGDVDGGDLNMFTLPQQCTSQGIVHRKTTEMGNVMLGAHSLHLKTDLTQSQPTHLPLKNAVRAR